MTKRARILAFMLLAAILVSCAPSTSEPISASQSQALVVEQQPQPTTTPTPRPTPGSLTISYAPEVPDELLSDAKNWGIPSVPDPSAAKRIIEIMRRLRPQLAIAARCRYNRHMIDLRKAGADIVIDEETDTGHELAHRVVAFMQNASGAGLACRMAGQTSADLDRSQSSVSSAL